jgi:hypothetical protein
VSDSDADAVLRRVQETLDAASLAVSQNKDWADRIRSNWGMTRVDETGEVKLPLSKK